MKEREHILDIQNNKTKGFVTIATGDEQYYQIAVNLLNSYKVFTKTPLPFAIIADKENKYTRLFDKVIILKQPYYSYMDKIQLLGLVPYDETVFVESDCLSYADMNMFFDAFDKADDFSAFGFSKPLTEKQCGWYKLEETGIYREKISFYQGFHSGVLFLRKTDTCKRMLEICNDILEHYDDYNIGGNKEMLDDKLLAVAAAAVGCRMTLNSVIGYSAFCVYPHVMRNSKVVRPSIITRSLLYVDDDKTKKRGIICHWGSIETRKPLYKREIIGLQYLLTNSIMLFIKYYSYNTLVFLNHIKNNMISFYWKIVKIPFVLAIIKKLVLIKRKLKSLFTL